MMDPESRSIYGGAGWAGIAIAIRNAGDRSRVILGHATVLSR